MKDMRIEGKVAGSPFGIDANVLLDVLKRDHGAAYHVKLYNEGMEYASKLAETYARKDPELAPVADQLRKYPDPAGLVVAQRMLTYTILTKKDEDQLTTEAFELSRVLEKLPYILLAEKTHAPNRNKWT